MEPLVAAPVGAPAVAPGKNSAWIKALRQRLLGHRHAKEPSALDGPESKRLYGQLKTARMRDPAAQSLWDKIQELPSRAGKQAWG